MGIQISRKDAIDEEHNAITISTKDSLPSLCVFFVDDFLGLDGHMDNVGGIRTEL